MRNENTPTLLVVFQSTLRTLHRAFGSVAEVEKALRGESYLPDHGLATAIFLAPVHGPPLLLEGGAGVGKTEVGKTLARILDADLIRLQCYEGIDASQALYEWDYARQLLYARALQEGEVASTSASPSSTGRFLSSGPCSRRSGPGAAPCSWSTSSTAPTTSSRRSSWRSSRTSPSPFPSSGDRAAEPPGRDHHVEPDAGASRRAQAPLSLPLDRLPDVEREAEIIRLRAPGVAEALARSVARDVARLRALDLVKRPGAAEAIDWAHGSLPPRRDDGRRRRRPGDDRRRGEEPRGPGARRRRLARARRLARSAAGRAGRSSSRDAQFSRRGRRQRARRRRRDEERKAGRGLPRPHADDMPTNVSGRRSSHAATLSGNPTLSAAACRTRQAAQSSTSLAASLRCLGSQTVVHDVVRCRPSLPSKTLPSAMPQAPRRGPRRGGLRMPLLSLSRAGRDAPPWS